MTKLMNAKLQRKKIADDFALRVRLCGEREHSGTVAAGDLMIKTKRPNAKLLVCARSGSLSGYDVRVRRWNSDKAAFEGWDIERVELRKALKWKNNYFAVPAKWVHDTSA